MQNSSPKPEKIADVETFTFPDALRHVLIGKRMSRIEWHDKEEYMYYDEKIGEYLIIHTLGQDHIFNLRGTDIDAIDWYILP